jgi:ATP-binding cassette subfamily F protein uup
MKQLLVIITAITVAAFTASAEQKKTLTPEQKERSRQIRAAKYREKVEKEGGIVEGKIPGKDILVINLQTSVPEAEIADVVKASDGHAVSATTYLNRFLFPHDTFTKRVDILSGGEKRRLYLLMVLMQNPNMLILDEPTNDLDIMTLNVLEEYLQEFKGSLIIVSHDRYFLDKCVDHLFVFEGNGRIKDFVGQYSEYREYIKEKEAMERSAERNATTTSKPQQQRSHDTSKRKLSYKEQRELEQIEQELQSLGEERSQLETEISSGTLPYDRLAEVSKRIEEIIAIIDEKEMRWLELNE